MGYNIHIHIQQGIKSPMIIVSQRCVNVNRKEEIFMKVKVRKRKPAPVVTEQVSSGVYVPRIFIDYISGSANVKDIRRAMEDINEKKNAMCMVDMRRNSPKIVADPPNAALLWQTRNAIEMMFKKIIYNNTSQISLEDRLALAESLCSREEAEKAGSPLTQDAYFEATISVKSLIFSIRERL